MPTKASKTSKAKPTAVQALLSKIKPTAAAKSKPTAPPSSKSAKANGKAVAKPAAQANSNGKSSAEKKGNGKPTAAPKANGKTSAEKKVNGKKVNGKVNTVVEKKAAAANQAKTETTTKAKTLLSAAKPTGKAPKPTKTSKPEPTKPSKAAATKSPTSKVKPPPKKAAPTSSFVRPTPPRPTKSKPVLDSNIKSLHKPFPPFDRIKLSGVPARRNGNSYQQVQQEGSFSSRSRISCPTCPTWKPALSTIQVLHFEPLMLDNLVFRKEAGSYKLDSLFMCHTRLMIHTALLTEAWLTVQFLYFTTSSFSS